MQGDAISSGFACISRRFSAGLVGLSQGKATQKCSQRRRKCASGILETHSKPHAPIAAAISGPTDRPSNGLPSAWAENEPHPSASKDADTFPKGEGKGHSCRSSQKPSPSGGPKALECVSKMRDVQFRVDWAAFQGDFPQA